MPTTDAPAPSPRRASRAARLLGAAAVLIALAGGAWAIGAAVDDYVTSIVLTGAWFVAVGIAAELIVRRRPGTGIALRGAFVMAVLVSAFGFFWTSVRDVVVDEQVVAGVAASSLPSGEAAAATPPSGDRPPAARAETPRVNVTVRTGAFESLAHETVGTASVVRRPDGERVLTLTGFRTDNGPDLRVYLVAGAVDDNGDGDGSIDLGRLKGNVGDQQYSIPAGADLARHATVVIWCRAFTVGFARAGLDPA